MTRYEVKPRGKNIRGLFCIFPKEGCFLEDGKINLQTEIRRVRARTASEALQVASNAGMVAGKSVWAIEIVEDDRIRISEHEL